MAQKSLTMIAGRYMNRGKMADMVRYNCYVITHHDHEESDCTVKRKLMTRFVSENIFSCDRELKE